MRCTLDPWLAPAKPDFTRCLRHRVAPLSGQTAVFASPLACFLAMSVRPRGPSAPSLFRFHQTEPRVTYLRFIDGLRAFAILPVLAFHLSPSLLPGGYLGVDVFFVISGFLITGVLIKDAEQGSRGVAVALLSFWERRMRRLLPASSLVLLVSFIGALVFLSLEDAEVFGGSLIAAALFHANIFFARTLDYFAAPPEQHPLLHFWSLAVEEQFYFIWPLVILLAFRFGRGRALAASIIVVLSLASFAWLLWGPDAASGQHFYLLTTRVWELGLGSLLALTLPLLHLPARLAQAVSLMAALVILASFAVLSEDYGLPGPASLPLVVSTAVLLWAGARQGGQAPTWITRALCWRGFVAIGLISYSLYLWHWPVLAFAHAAFAGALPLWSWLPLLALIFMASLLSWRFVERPIRRWKGAVTTKLKLAVVGGSLAGLLALAGLGGSLIALDGMPWRLSGVERLIYSQQATSNPYRKRCDSWQKAEAAPEFCTLGRAYDRQHGYDALLIGSSFADHHVPGLKLWAEQQGISLRQVTNSTCSGVPGLIRPTYKKVQMCKDYHQTILRMIESNPNLKLLILANHFRFAADFEALLAAGDPHTQALADFATDLQARGIALQIIAPIESSMTLRDPCIKQAMLDVSAEAACGKEKTEGLRQTEAFYAGLAARFDGLGLSLPSAAMCPDGLCRLVADGTLLYRNEGHLNAYGARWLAPKLGLPDLVRR